MSNNQDKHQSGTLSLKRTPEQSMSSLTSEQKVSVSGARASEPVVNSMAQNTKTVKADKKDKQKEELSSLGKLLLLVFVPEKKDGKEKVAVFTQKLQSALRQLKTADDLTKAVVDECTKSIPISDPDFSRLLLVLLLTQDADANVRQKVVGFCVEAVSANWVESHRGSTNLFIDVASSIDLTNPGLLALLTHTITERYKKRIDLLKPSQKDDARDGQEFRSFTPAQLQNQCENLITMGYLWAVETGKCSPEKAIYQFEKRLTIKVSELNADKRVCFFLAAQMSDIKSGIAETIRFFQRQIEELKDKSQFYEGSRDALQRELTTLSAQNRELQSHVVDLQSQLDDLKQQLDKEKMLAHEQQLDEKAERVHLRDDVGKAKAKAYNLLHEEVVMPLQLSLKALQREVPKVANAEHQIELVLESIEREIEWFKK
ncbi:hypothetical protein [Shewanella algae]|uniref:hypothetical protein n=1 Tax=Shewanella algae TaxID=38313 RepID=UPI0031F59C6B